MQTNELTGHGLHGPFKILRQITKIQTISVRKVTGSIGRIIR